MAQNEIAVDPVAVVEILKRRLSEALGEAAQWESVAVGLRKQMAAESEAADGLDNEIVIGDDGVDTPSSP